MARETKRTRKHEPYYRIKAYQIMLKMTNKDVADALGIKERTYWEKVNGFSDFTFTEGLKLSALFNQPVEEIFLT